MRQVMLARLGCDDISATDRRNFQPIVRPEIRVPDLQMTLAAIVLGDINGPRFATFQGECSDGLIAEIIKYFKLVGSKCRAAVM